MESAPKKFLVETEAEADNMPGEDPEIDENDDPVADPPETAPNEGVKEKTGSRGGKRNRKWKQPMFHGPGQLPRDQDWSKLIVSDFFHF